MAHVGEVPIDHSPEVVVAGSSEDVFEAGHVSPGEDDVVDSVPVIVAVVTTLEMLINVVGRVGPTLSHLVSPLEWVRDLEITTVDVTS